MNKIKLLFTIISLTSLPAVADESLARKILNKAEQIRAPENGRSQVSLRSQSGDQLVDYDLDILIGSGRRGLVNFLAPMVERGRRMLVVPSFQWMRFRSSKRAIAISNREAIGNSTFALVDIFRMDTSEYDVEIRKLSSEASKSEVSLELTAKAATAAYTKIIYVVEAQSWFPIRVHFYGPSGKLLKSMYSESKAQLGNMLRVGSVRMVDEITENRISWWKTKSLIEEKFPEQVFTTSYLLQD
jgi:outer membrane lipoprotein-sorting protein